MISSLGPEVDAGMFCYSLVSVAASDFISGTIALVAAIVFVLFKNPILS